MSLQEIKKRLLQLSSEHDETSNDLDGLKDAEFIESIAIQLIVDFCREQQYEVEGFPFQKEKEVPEENHEYYFSEERDSLYINKLSLEKRDVLELNWFYNYHFFDMISDTPDGFVKDVELFLDCMGHIDFEYNEDEF